MKQLASAVIEQDLRWLVRQSRAPRLRSLRQFAEEEIVIPDGPHAGRRFRCSRQPYTGLWFDAVDSGHWSRFVATGPTQSGKTLSCFIIPLLYHLLEIGETVICGVPDMDMGGDKWREDVLPVIEQSRYRDLLPRSGAGSRGGHVESIQFGNGATLKFMSGGGGDKSRAGFTSRVVVITETDGMDQASASSRESDKVTQLEARTKAYGRRARLYMECTVSTDSGRTWQEYSQGTASQILLPCSHCRQYVAPEREHLQGWLEAASQADAREVGAFYCPQCGEAWSEADRRQANERAQLVHRGQRLNAGGERMGDPPRTNTLGFRWSGVHNLFQTAGDLAAGEWDASHAHDEDNAERAQRQFVWCIPVESPRSSILSFEHRELASRILPLRRGILPADTQQLSAAMDLGKYLTHWVLIAWREGATPHVVDYGRIEVPSQELGVEQALMVALRQFREQVLAGWPKDQDPRELKLQPGQVWIDAGYTTDVVYTFCRESGARFRPSVGRGALQHRQQNYHRPTSTGSIVQLIGQNFHYALLPEQIHLVEVDADFWKSWVHQRLETPLGSPGAMTFFQAQPQEHTSLVRHLTAESKVEEYVAGHGMVTRWERMRRDNHFFDAMYNACAAGWACGARLLTAEPPATKGRAYNVIDPGARRDDGRPWVDLSRWHGIRRR